MKKLMTLLSLALIASYLVIGCSPPEESGTTGATAGADKAGETAGADKAGEGK